MNSVLSNFIKYQIFKFQNPEILNFLFVKLFFNNFDFETLKLSHYFKKKFVYFKRFRLIFLIFYCFYIRFWFEVNLVNQKFKSSKNQNLKFLNSKFLYIIQRKYVIQRDSFDVSGPKVTHANIVSHVDDRLDGLVVLGHQRRMQLDRGRVRGVVVLVRHRLRRQALDVETVGGLQQGRQLRVVNTHLAAVHKLQQRLQVVGVHAGQHDDRMFARGVLRGGRGEKETERKQRNLVSDEKKEKKER